jgi:hypothetical protein
MSGTLSCVRAGRPEPEPPRGSTVVIAVLVILVALSGVTLPRQDMLVALMVEIAASVIVGALQVCCDADGRHA